MTKAELFGVPVGIASAGIALGAWLFPFTPTAPPPATWNPPAGSVADPPRPTTVSSAGPATPSGVPLKNLTAESGGANVAQLPRALRARPEYGPAIAIQCPTNQSDDKERSVTYPLRGRYLDFSGTAEPFFTGDPQATARLTVVTGVRERDDTLTSREQGSGDATMSGPVTVAADVEGAEDLTLRVRCTHPAGVVVVRDARLTPR